MKIITSKDNEKIKFLRKLKLKKYREKHNKFFVENFNIIKDALEAEKFSSLYITESFINKHSKLAGWKSILEKAEECYVISEKINKSFSELDTPSGICAVYARRKEEIDFKSPVVYLNNISDPGNLGTILRSALAFNFKNIAVDEGCADLYNAKTINAAKDSIFKLNIARDRDLKIFKKIKEKMKIFTTRLEGGEDINILKNNKLFCAVFGSESGGVSDKIRGMSDKFIKIKMSEEIESLNAAVAASIIFYEARKK